MIKSNSVAGTYPINTSGAGKNNAVIEHPVRVGSDLQADRYQLPNTRIGNGLIKPALLNRSRYLIALLGLVLVAKVGNAAHVANSVKAIPIFELIAVADVTAYSWHDDNIDWGAFERTIHEGSIAISRDLESLGLLRGSLVYIEGIGVYTVKDRTGKKWNLRVDVYVHDQKEAHKFGIKKKIRIFKITLPKGEHWKN